MTPKEMILASRKEAQTHMDAILAANPLTEDILYNEILEFIRCKFMLSSEDCKACDYNFDAMSTLSLSNSMKISKELVEQFDMAKSCDGVSSAMAKKVLLFMAIQKSMNITLPARETATVKTVRDISTMIWTTLNS